ncbi:MAG: L-2-hydroxyglutarate oxidase [Saprospiraceae bacterium]
MKQADVVIIGGGIVGLATAYQLLKSRRVLTVRVLEKESEIASHQTGHNSGVIHSGVYYKPGSLKAKNCRSGYVQLLNFCKEHGIKHDVCGKIILATKEDQLPLLQTIFERGQKNGLTGLQLIGPEQIKELEPNAQGVKAIKVPQAGIINYKNVAQKYAELIQVMGGEVLCDRKVVGIKDQVVETNQDNHQAKLIVNCAGLYADKIAKMTMPDLDLMTLPFRGEYYELVAEKENLVKNLIYPVPNPAFPFLGVHFTRMIDGGMEAGPNAVLAFRREGYSNKDFKASEFFETIGYPGFRKVAAKYWKDGLYEIYRSFSKAAFTKALQGLVPSIEEKDLKKGGAGVRAQAVDSKGNLIDDFLFYENERVINVCNAPSPAATASLAIGETVAGKILTRF